MATSKPRFTPDPARSVEASATRARPQPKPHWLSGDAAAFRQAPHTFVADLSARGGIAPFRIFHRNCVAVSAPEYVHHVLVVERDRYQRSFHMRNLGIISGPGLLSTDGDFWWKRRRQIQPSFRLDAMKRLVPAVCGVLGRLFEQWESRPARELSVIRDMHRLTMSAMGQMLISADIADHDVAAVGNALHTGLHLIRRRNSSVFAAPLWLPTPANRRLSACRNVIDDFARQHVTLRLQHPNPDLPDILNALIEAADPETGEHLSPEAIIDETRTLFLAGYETTSNALCWALYLIARHPRIAAIWRAELDAVLDGRPPGWDDLPRLAYTAHIVHETLRLYPPVYNIARECVADDNLGGLRLARGSLVVISIWGLHRAGDWGSDPESFRPERFASGRPWPKNAFLPFASGKHVCIGNHFALTEMMVAFAMLGQRYRFEPADPEPVNETAQITLVPSREFRLRIAPRR